MAYAYEGLKNDFILTDEGNRRFIRARDAVLSKMKATGAFRAQEMMSVILTEGRITDSFMALACIDRMVEIGDLALVYRGHVGQLSIYTEAGGGAKT